MLRDQKDSEMFLFVQLFKEAEVLCVPALLPPPPKSNGCSLQKSHLYKENITKKKKQKQNSVSLSDYLVSHILLT